MDSGPWRVPWGRTESDTTERLSMHAHTLFFEFFSIMVFYRILNVILYI